MTFDISKPITRLFSEVQKLPSEKNNVVGIKDLSGTEISADKEIETLSHTIDLSEDIGGQKYPMFSAELRSMTDLDQKKFIFEDIKNSINVELDATDYKV